MYKKYVIKQEYRDMLGRKPINPNLDVAIWYIVYQRLTILGITIGLTEIGRYKSHYDALAAIGNNESTTDYET